MSPPDDPGALHIFLWARNSREHCEAMRAALAYPDGDNFAAARALGLVNVARDTFKAMKPDREGEDYGARDIVAAALIMLDWDGEE